MRARSRRTSNDVAEVGLLEEALYALEAGQPLHLAGGFGGITHDIALRLGVDDGNGFRDFRWPRISASSAECSAYSTLRARPEAAA